MKALILALLMLPLSLRGQEPPKKEFDLEAFADEIFSTQDADVDFGEFYENLTQLLSNPLDLNEVTAEQLRSLLILNENQIGTFLRHRAESGPLLSTYELQAIPGWDQSVLDRILPFVGVRSPEAKLDKHLLSRIRKEKNNLLLVRYERSLALPSGFNSDTDGNKAFAGTPDKLLLRSRVARSGDFSLGLAAENDPGEMMRWTPAQHQYGFDFLSAHAQFQNKGLFKNLIVGDYQCQFGQGLLLGSVYGFGKNSEAITTVRRSNLGFLPYTSLNENQFFRGLAASVRISSSFMVHTFYSAKSRDGTGTMEEGSVSSLSTTGLHRTTGELQSRGRLRESDAGLILQFQRAQLDAGVIFQGTYFNKAIAPEPNLYNQFYPRGRVHQNGGVYFNYSWSSFTFFSEVALTINHGHGGVAGLLGSFGKNMEFAVLLRSFAKDFHSFYSNAFSESSTPQNEDGFYWGFRYRFNKQLALSGYVDLFRFPWMRYRVYSPSDGYEVLLRLQGRPSKTFSWFVQVREETKQRNTDVVETLYRVGTIMRRNAWVNCEYQAIQGLKLRVRIQGSQFTQSGSTTSGMVCAQDITYTRMRWSLSFRLALFDTDNFDNRQYLYEKDVWLAYSMPAYEGHGTRNYVLLHCALSKRLDFWFRWSETRFTDREVIGSGPEQITGNTRNDVKFQVRCRF